MNEILILVAHGSRRDVFCRIGSISQSEFYAANATDFRPEIKFVLADYLDYSGETMAIYNGKWFRIIRAYRTGQEIELVAERAPAEDGEIYG